MVCADSQLRLKTEMSGDSALIDVQLSGREIEGTKN